MNFAAEAMSMRKLNPPQHRTRMVKVTRPVVDPPGLQGLWRVEDLRGEHDDDWIKPERYHLDVVDPMTGLRATVADAVGARPYGVFLAQRIAGEWKFKRFLAQKHMNW